MVDQGCICRPPSVSRSTPDLSRALPLRARAVREQGRRPRPSRSRPRSRPQGGGVRRQTGRGARSDGPSRAARRGSRDPGAAHQDRCRGRSAGRGLEHAVEPSCEEGAAERRRLEHLLHELGLGRCALTGGECGDRGRRREGLVRLVIERRAGADANGLDPHRRSREAKQLAEQIQVVAFDEVPYVPWGQYVQPAVYRKTVRGVLQFPAALLWNVWMEA